MRPAGSLKVIRAWCSTWAWPHADRPASAAPSTRRSVARRACRRITAAPTAGRPGNAHRDLVFEPVVLLDGMGLEAQRLGPVVRNDRAPRTEACRTGGVPVGRLGLEPSQPIAVLAEGRQHQTEVQLVSCHEVQDAPDVFVAAPQHHVRLARRRRALGPDSEFLLGSDIGVEHGDGPGRAPHPLVRILDGDTQAGLGVELVAHGTGRQREHDAEESGRGGISLHGRSDHGQILSCVSHHCSFARAVQRPPCTFVEFSAPLPRVPAPTGAIQHSIRAVLRSKRGLCGRRAACAPWFASCTCAPVPARSDTARLEHRGA